MDYTPDFLDVDQEVIVANPNHEYEASEGQSESTTMGVLRLIRNFDLHFGD